MTDRCVIQQYVMTGLCIILSAEKEGNRQKRETECYIQSREDTEEETQGDVEH
jgi:hypothetical protein